MPIPTGACWLNLQEGWWRLFRREAFAGQDFADATEIDQATRVATQHPNARAKPWIWGVHHHHTATFVVVLSTAFEKQSTTLICHVGAAHGRSVAMDIEESGIVAAAVARPTFESSAEFTGTDSQDDRSGSTGARSSEYPWYSSFSSSSRYASKHT